jgi:exonuclease III
MASTSKVLTPRVVIDNPKNEAGLDLSDHYPILVVINNLKILSANVQFLPSIIGNTPGKNTIEGVTHSIQDFANYFAKTAADICCVQELFAGEANRLLEEEMLKRGYVACERVGSSSLITALNGGVRTFVEKEIAQDLTTYEHIYQNKIDYFIGADALVDKGITHTSFIKDGQKYHLFNTHLQAFYDGREHYTEITLAQCVELKNFVEAQKAKGIIKPDDIIVIGGDFNIPKPGCGEETTLLYKKMQRILGPQFTILDYEPNPSGPKHTISRENSYNRHLPPGSDRDVCVDMMITFNPVAKDSPLADIELSTIYGDLQLSISRFVSDNATLFTLWKLTRDEKAQLEAFNLQVEDLFAHAEELKLQNINPLNDPEWFALALQLLSGPERTNTLPHNESPRSEIRSEVGTISEEDLVPENLEQCKEKFDKLLGNLRKVHEQLHKDYISSPTQYKDMFATSLMMNHVLLHAGNDFFKKPTVASYERFQKTCKEQLNTAQQVFAKDASIWQRLNPIFKQLLGLLSIITVVPGILIAAKATHGFSGTFFAAPATQTIEEIKHDFEEGTDSNQNEPE